MTEQNPRLAIADGPMAATTEDPHLRLSEVLSAIVADASKDRISVGDLLDALRHRALGALIFIFSVPNALPMPPGVSAILGAPLLFLTAQLMLGMRPWLPSLITSRSLSRTEFQRVVTTIVPWLARAEGIMRPRFSFLARRPSINLVGLVCVVLAIVLFLPIPLGNMLPSLALSIMSLGLLQRDGLWIVIGVLVGLASIVIVWGVVWALVFAALYLLTTFFGFTI
jgi:hypothetical protein